MEKQKVGVQSAQQLLYLSVFFFFFFVHFQRRSRLLSSLHCLKDIFTFLNILLFLERKVKLKKKKKKKSGWGRFRRSATSFMYLSRQFFFYSRLLSWICWAIYAAPKLYSVLVFCRPLILFVFSWHTEHIILLSPWPHDMYEKKPPNKLSMDPDCVRDEDVLGLRFSGGGLKTGRVKRTTLRRH